MNIANGQTPLLSPQNLIDCATTNSGCNGGDVGNALIWIQNNGVAIETDYPYSSGSSLLTGTCNTSVAKNTKIAGMENCVNCSRNELISMLQNGPVVAAVNADDTFMHYVSGIINFNTCGPTNHAIVIYGIGYDQSGKEYVMARNSWAQTWGESGNFRMYINTLTPSSCYITNYAWRPVINPPVPCAKLFSTCDSTSAVMSICDTKTTLASFNNFPVSTADSAQYNSMIVFTGENCTGSSYGFFGGKMQCFPAPFLLGVKSIVIVKETPPDNCIWVFTSRCNTGNKVEICNNAPSLAALGINKVLSLQKGKLVTSTVLYLGLNYASSKFTIAGNVYGSVNLDNYAWQSVQLIK
jgi:hypothetical protein